MSATATVNANQGLHFGTGGDEQPLKSSYGKLMMWYFLLSDAFTFGGLLIAYGALRFTSGHDVWPDPNEVFSAFPGIAGKAPLMFVSLMTFILIMSSVTMVRAVQEGHQMNKKKVAMWLGFTIIGGIAFLGCQAIEWEHLISHGMTMTAPWVNHETGFEAPTVFGQLFFTITGFHGFHVTTGILMNIILFICTLSGTFERRGHYEMIEKIGLYWHFVDLVWVFVFLAFYLL